MKYLDGPRPRLFAHRGASGVAPENTLAAFRAAVDAGADRLELDVHATADGHVVVSHDETVDRTTDSSGPIKSLRLADLVRLDAGFRFVGPGGDHPFRLRGERIPTLAELLETFPDIPLNIEVKQEDPPIVREVLDVLDRFDARGRVLLAAEGDPIMARIREAAPDILTGFTANEVITFLQQGREPGYRPPGAALQVPPSYFGIPIVTADTVARAHALGVEVHVWTINDEAEMDSLLDLGVDALMSDFPSRAMDVLRRRGERASRT
jgi:glycerophosphoryl diester phosphodiesterase